MQLRSLPLLLLFASVAFGGGLEEPVVLDLHTGGMPGSHEFHVQLLSTGHLTVIHRRLPVTSKGLTESRHEIDLSPESVNELLSLAAESDDFSQGCNLVADGTTASLSAVRGKERFERSCANAPHWPVGPKTIRLLEALNKSLPGEFKVF